MKSSIRAVLWTASVLVLSTQAVASECNEACLRAQAERYVEALVNREPEAIKVTDRLRYTENGAEKVLGEGLWQAASSLGSDRYIVSDASTQQTMFIGIVNEGDAPALATIRLQIDGDAIAQIEHVVARKGSHALFAPEAFKQPHPSLTTQVEQRQPREKLIAIAETYFEGLEQHSSKVIQSSTSCQRIENGVQTTGVAGRTSKHCAESADVLTYIKSVDDRRYPIVDVAHGVVVSTVLFDIEGERNEANAARISNDPAIVARLRQPRTLLLTEWFKIDDGKIQYIEAVMQNLPRGSKSGWEHAAAR